MATSKSKRGQEGFTLIEVLVGIIISTVFVLVASQAIAISALFRVRAQREAEAVAVIQQDLEDIKFISIQPLSATCEDPTIVTGYGQALIDTVPAVTSPITLLNKSYTMERNLDVLNQEPFNLMTISYSVSDPDSGRVIADLYTEVVPDAAFNCNP